MALGEYREDALAIRRILRQPPSNPQATTV
jgi:hypothetical protein